jgi:hypothetical protein
MVTGKKAFEGETQASLIHAIMGIDPPPISSAFDSAAGERLWPARGTGVPNAAAALGWR